MGVLSVPCEEVENGLRLQLLRGKIEERLLLKYHLYYPRDPSKLFQKIQKDEQQLRSLMRRKVLSKVQYDLLLPASGLTNSGRFDVTLLVVLLREFCGIPEPVTGWYDDPAVNDTSEGAHLVRFRLSRNKIQHEKCEVSNRLFKEIFMYVKPALLNYGCTIQEVNSVLTCPLDGDLMAKLDFERKRVNHLESCLIGFTYGLFPAVHNFFGRNEELKQLHHQLMNLGAGKLGLVLSGLGGIGKSELCRKYCKEYGSIVFCNNVLWVNGECETSFQQSFQMIAEGINLTTTDDHGHSLSVQTIVNKVYRYFHSRRLLVVFDGVESYSILGNYLPCPQISSNVSVLVTSQNKNCTSRFVELQLKVFTPESAIEFMRRNLDEKKYSLSFENTNYLTKFLGWHPLALQQAVSYIKENNMSVDQFNILLQQQAPDILKEASAVDIGQKSVMTTLALALSKLRKTTDNACAIDLLHIMCFLNVRSINRRLLYEALHDDVTKTNKAIKTLKTYSLINVMDTVTDEIADMNDQIISIHSLVQMAIQHEQKDGTSNKLKYEETLDVIFKDRSNEDDVTEPFYKHKHLCDHIVHIYNQPLLRDQLLLKAIHRIHFLFQIFKVRAMYKELQRILVSARAMLTKTEEVERCNKNLLVDIEYYIALLLSYRKLYDEALVMFRRMESSLQRNSKELYEILSIQSNIGSCLLDKKDFQGALDIFQEVEQFELNLYPTGHPSLLTTQSNIALCLLHLERSDDALSILCNVEQQKLRLYRRDSPEVLLTQSNLAYCLYVRRDYDEALEILKRVEECQQSYDDEHPDVKNTKEGIQLCLRKIRKRRSVGVKCSCIVN